MVLLIIILIIIAIIIVLAQQPKKGRYTACSKSGEQGQEQGTPIFNKSSTQLEGGKMANYKVEFLPADIVVRAGKIPEAVKVIEQIINKYTAQGYELIQVAQISVIEKPGCLAALFGAKPTSTNYNMIVFRK